MYRVMPKNDCDSCIKGITTNRAVHNEIQDADTFETFSSWLMSSGCDHLRLQGRNESKDDPSCM